jgi:hypothetical protein
MISCTFMKCKHNNSGKDGICSLTDIQIGKYENRNIQSIIPICINFVDKNSRTSKILIGGKWIDINGIDIKKGMVFKLFESDGTPVGDKDSYIASADSYLTRDGIICTPCY